MDNQTLIERLMSIEAWATGLKEEATKTRKELELVSAPAPRKGDENGITEADRLSIKKMLAEREQYIISQSKKS